MRNEIKRLLWAVLLAVLFCAALVAVDLLAQPNFNLDEATLIDLERERVQWLREIDHKLQRILDAVQGDFNDDLECTAEDIPGFVAAIKRSVADQEAVE